MQVSFVVTVLSVSPRRNYIVFSTRSPAAVQRIPWPQMHNQTAESSDEDLHAKNTNKPLWSGHDTWVLDDLESPFLIDPDGVLFYRLRG